MISARCCASRAESRTPRGRSSRRPSGPATSPPFGESRRNPDLASRPPQSRRLEWLRAALGPGFLAEAATRRGGRLLLRLRGFRSLLLDVVELSRELLQPKKDSLAPLTQPGNLLAKIGSGGRQPFPGSLVHD